MEIAVIHWKEIQAEEQIWRWKTFGLGRLRLRCLWDGQADIRKARNVGVSTINSGVVSWASLKSPRNGRGGMEWRASLRLPPRVEWRGRGERNYQQRQNILSWFCLHCCMSRIRANQGAAVLILLNCPSTKYFSGNSCPWIFLNRETFKRGKEHHIMTGFYQVLLACLLQQPGSLPIYMLNDSLDFF